MDGHIAPTRGQQMLALRRARMAASPPFLRGGFRPFFFGGALWAAVALALWLGALAGALSLPSLAAPLDWHRHEMLFGFVGAAMAGYLLTNVANRSGRLPIAGLPLASLFLLWAGARLALLFSAHTGPLVPLLAETGFFLFLAGAIAREVLPRGGRNRPILLLLLLFAAAAGLDQLALVGRVDDPMLAIRFGLAIVVTVISLVGGRIIPSFTRNWLMKRGKRSRLPGQPGRRDAAVVAVTFLALAAWTAWPAGRAVPFLLLVAALAQFARLAGWRGEHCLGNPMLLILHVGHAWVPIGLLLLAAQAHGAPVPQSAGVHALTAGAMGSLVLAVMSRSALSFTDREVQAGPGLCLAFILVTVGAAARVGAPLGLFAYTPAMHLSALAWGGAWIAFLTVMAPVFFAARLGDPQG